MPLPRRPALPQERPSSWKPLNPRSSRLAVSILRSSMKRTLADFKHKDDRKRLELELEGLIQQAKTYLPTLLVPPSSIKNLSAFEDVDVEIRQARKRHQVASFVLTSLEKNQSEVHASLKATQEAAQTNSPQRPQWPAVVAVDNRDADAWALPADLLASKFWLPLDMRSKSVARDGPPVPTSATALETFLWASKKARGFRF